MTLYDAKLEGGLFSGDFEDRNVTVAFKGFLVNEKDDIWHGQASFPRTVAHFDHLVNARDVGAVATPYWNSRRRVPGDGGVAIVSKITDTVSVSANLSRDGAVEFACKLLHQAAGQYGSHPPESLLTALEKAVEALREVSRIEADKRSKERAAEKEARREMPRASKRSTPAQQPSKGQPKQR